MHIAEVIRRGLHRLRGGVIHLRPQGNEQGSVLLSYITLPFLNRDPKILDAHTNRWECLEIASIFLARGYAVDVVDFTNSNFIPKKSYTYCIDIGSNMERISPFLNKDCIKIFHITGAFWQFQNNAEEKRLLDLKKRRGVELPARRAVPPTRAIELCDIATMLGNNFTASTYPPEHQHKIVRIPLSTTHHYPSPRGKDFNEARNQFIWFGGAGLVHKGFDLVLEAFAQMPEYNLTMYGKIGEGEKDLLAAYAHELSLPNIKVGSFLDPGGKEFEAMRNKTIALIYPSCSEGQSGSVVLCMHAGLIPIISSESGVDVEQFGVILDTSSIDEIKRSIREIAALSGQELQNRSVAAWEYANNHHTRATFSKSYNAFVDMLTARYHV